MLPNSTWHEKCNWRAEEYFDDPQVIALCRAIQANDLEGIDRLVAAGVDVNAQGHDKMTPLLWAYPDNKLERFKRLLEHGADPNVVIEGDFNTRGGMSPGDSVTHLAAATRFPGYFEAVFEHGGNPNLQRTSLLGSNDSPLFTVVKFGGSDKKKIQLLIDKGTDLNHINATGVTPTMQAVGWGGQYDIALMLLKAGAGPRIYQSNQAQKLIHVVARQVDTHLVHASGQQKNDYQELVRWLEDHGESLDAAREDLRRWASWNNASGEYRRKMDAEIAERKAREANERAVDKVDQSDH